MVQIESAKTPDTPRTDDLATRLDWLEAWQAAERGHRPLRVPVFRRED